MFGVTTLELPTPLEVQPIFVDFNAEISLLLSWCLIWTEQHLFARQSHATVCLYNVEAPPTLREVKEFFALCVCVHVCVLCVCMCVVCAVCTRVYICVVCAMCARVCACEYVCGVISLLDNVSPNGEATPL